MPRRNSSDEVLQLSKVIGLTALNGSAISSSPSIEGFIYSAGSVAIHYSPKEDDQVAFYTTTKPISSLALSQDGRFLSIGERGHLPGIVIWDILKHEKIMTLQGHKNGISCLAFSPNGRYLVSVGFKPDKQLFFWDWESGKKLSTQRVGNKVHSIHYHHTGNYFITAGDRHLKWWYVTEVLDGEAVGLEGKPASINEEHRTSIFVEVICGYGGTEGKTFCATSQGILCCFNEDRLVEKWVKLETSTAFSMELFSSKDSAGLLVVGCANGAIRAFAPKTLEYIETFPRPIPLEDANIPLDGSITRDDTCKYAACYALRRVPGTKADPIPKLAAIYADRSLIIWDISDIFAVKSHRSFLHHRSCIWDIQFIERSQLHPHLQEEIFPASSTHSNNLPVGSFVTCSADNTIRFWDINSSNHKRAVHASLDRPSDVTNLYCQFSSEMLNCIEFLSAEDAEGGIHDYAVDQSRLDDSRSLIASTATGFSITNARGAAAVDFDYSKGIPDLEIPDRPQSSFAPRTIAIHPFGHQLVCGDRTGKLRVYDLTTMKLIHTIQAHSAEILAVTFSPPQITLDDGKTWTLYSSETADEEEKVAREDVLVLLATAGRDRLIHLFHANSYQVNNQYGYTPLETLDRHSSSVTSLRFSNDGKQLISCSGDKTIVFNKLEGPHITKFKSIPTPTGTINGLAVEVSNKFAITSGQDKRLHIWNLAEQKFMRAHKSTEYLNHELYKTDVDPSGSFIITSGFDKSLTLLDFFSGEVLCQLFGHHSELITGLKFSPDGSYLISIGGDGCIFVWKTSSFLMKSMKDRLMELFMKAQKRNNKVLIRQASSSVVHSHIPQTKSPNRPFTAPSSTSDQLHSSLSNLKMKIQTKNTLVDNADSAPAVNTNMTSTASTSATTTTQAKKNKWAENLEKEKGGYELAGKKIEVIPSGHSLGGIGGGNSSAIASAMNRNKFTLELTSSLLDEKTIHPSDRVRVSKENDVDESLLVAEGGDEAAPKTESSTTAAVLESSMLAATHEATDGVNLPDMSSSEEDDDEAEKLFKSLDEYESDFDVVSPEKSTTNLKTGEKASTSSSRWTPSGSGGIAVEEEDKELTNAQSNIDHLEKSAKDLESWLEDMLRNDSKLDETVSSRIKSSSSPTTTPAKDSKTSNTISPAKKLPEDNDMLNSSLSSAFFRGIKTSAANQTAESSVLPIPPLISVEKSDTGKPSAESIVTSSQILKEQKLRESATAVAQMRERLRALESSSSFSKLPLNESHDNGSFQKKQPSKKEENQPEGKADYNLHPPSPPPTNTSSKMQTASSVNTSAFFNNSQTSTITSQQFLEKKKQFQQTLMAFNQAKENAMRSYEELLQLQSSLNFSTTESSSFNDLTPMMDESISMKEKDGFSTLDNQDIVLLRESVQETNDLLQAFRASLLSTTTLPTPPPIGSNTTTSRLPGAINTLSLTNSSSSPGPVQEVDISHILEQYSNKLIEVLRSKMEG